MSKTRRLPFMDREIELRVVPVGVLLDAADMVNEGKPILDASFMTLCASAFWVDTGKQAFADRAACRAVPGDRMAELMTLVRECSELNRPDFGQLTGAAPAPNGHDAAPSL